MKIEYVPRQKQTSLRKINRPIVKKEISMLRWFHNEPLTTGSFTALVNYTSKLSDIDGMDMSGFFLKNARDNYGLRNVYDFIADLKYRLLTVGEDGNSLEIQEAEVDMYQRELDRVRGLRKYPATADLYIEDDTSNVSVWEHNANDWAQPLADKDVQHMIVDTIKALQGDQTVIEEA